MDNAEKTLVVNIEKITGKTVSEWIAIVQSLKLATHGQIVSMLKSEYGFTHGYANYIAHKSLKSDAGSATDSASLISEQYKGEKKLLLPIYELLVSHIQGFGSDVLIDPKKSYVSFKRKKQFALIQPSTKTRLDIGLNLKGKAPGGILELSGTFNAMCSHRIRIETLSQVNKNVIGLILESYQNAG